MVLELYRSFPDDHCCSLLPRQRGSSRFWLVVWGLFLGICNIVLCGYIEIVEEQACHNHEFRLTCPSLDTHMAILEAVFTPANSTSLIISSNRTDFIQDDEGGFTCSECFFQSSYPHTSSEKYNNSKRVVAEDRSIERNLRAPVSHRCAGINHCSFIMNIDFEESIRWGAGIVYIKYACMDGTRLTKYCNTDVAVGEGFVQSPGYPQFYIGNSTCRWLLRAGQGQVVQLTLLDLSFRAVVDPYEKDCVDKLIIRDGIFGDVLLSTCEQVDYPVIYESKGEILDIFVKANSKVIYPKRGVLFHYKAVGCVTPRAPPGGYLAWRRGAEAHFMCCVGHSFPDGQRHRTLRCLRQNTWDTSLPPCIGKDVKIWEGNGTFVANQTRIAAEDKNSGMLVDVIIPSLLIAALFLGNAVIVFIIFKYRKRKEDDMDGEEFTTLTRNNSKKNGNTMHVQNDEMTTNSV